MTHDRELLAQWMIRHGFATGHGDTVEGLLAELEWQTIELRRRLDAGKPAGKPDVAAALFKDALTDIRAAIKAIRENEGFDQSCNARDWAEAAAEQLVDGLKALAKADVTHGLPTKAETERPEYALALLCDEIEMSMPDDPQEFNAENIWGALKAARATLVEKGSKP